MTTQLDLDVRLLLNALCGEPCDPNDVQAVIDRLDPKTPLLEDLVEFDYNEQLHQFRRDVDDAEERATYMLLTSPEGLAQTRARLETEPACHLDELAFETKIDDSFIGLDVQMAQTIIRERALAAGPYIEGGCPECGHGRKQLGELPCGHYDYGAPECSSCV